MAYEFFDSEVTQILDETHNVKRFFFKVNGFENFEFKPGQFVMLDLPIDSKVTNRSYSIASNPVGNNEFELVIVHKPDGLGTTFLFNKNLVRPGTHLKCSKAIGKFTLDESTEKEICFICTGTGIAPFRAMLMDLERKGTLKDKKINLIFGCRFEKDILYRKQFENLAAQYPNFQYHPVLSRDSDDWHGERGYVHLVYEKIYANKQPAIFYICGWKDMIMQARDTLQIMGYDRKEIKFELYD
jgi:CDP-4-dehydro-6-deoxyglucose reductase